MKDLLAKYGWAFKSKCAPCGGSAEYWAKDDNEYQFKIFKSYFLLIKNNQQYFRGDVTNIEQKIKDISV